MTPTEKILEEFDRLNPKPTRDDSVDDEEWEMIKNGWEITIDFRAFLISKITQAVAEEKKRMVKHVNKTLNRYVVKKEPLCEQNSLILLIRSHLLASLDKPDKEKHVCCDGECNHDDCCGKVEANCPLTDK